MGLVQVVDAAGLADGMALFRVEGGSMTLVGSRHMPASWQERAAGGVPLDPSFASAQSVLSGQIVQFADVRSVSEHFDATARELASDGGVQTFDGVNFVFQHSDCSRSVCGPAAL